MPQCRRESSGTSILVAQFDDAGEGIVWQTWILILPKGKEDEDLKISGPRPLVQTYPVTGEGTAKSTKIGWNVANLAYTHTRRDDGWCGIPSAGKRYEATLDTEFAIVARSPPQRWSVRNATRKPQ